MTDIGPRKDANQDEIVRKCEAIGMLVEKISRFRGHSFDLLIGHNDIWLIFEIKATAKSRVTDKEKTFYDKCKRRGLPLYHVSMFEQIVGLFNYELDKRTYK